MHIQVLLLVIYNPCLIMAEDVLILENMKLNYCDDPWLKTSSFPYFEGDKRL